MKSAPSNEHPFFLVFSTP